MLCPDSKELLLKAKKDPLFAHYTMVWVTGELIHCYVRTPIGSEMIMHNRSNIRLAATKSSELTSTHPLRSLNEQELYDKTFGGPWQRTPKGDLYE